MEHKPCLCDDCLKARDDEVRRARNGAIDECLNLVEVSAHRAAVAALNFYNQMAVDLRGLKK